ncbi:hypothetical protein G7Y89_g744 [Cudoniella acicularis]|uniref:Helicase ATP-binding domain-containing protein n=1 Tax=Cudoniella acicularis TaxID=354080 RepID=A0A8H4RYB2_9HELO|nr:hypothetical protein G7Y89_g744 [Cudoniella acicularis]
MAPKQDKVKDHIKMHELFLTAHVPNDDLSRAVRILQGYCGTKPQAVLSRRLLWEGPKTRNNLKGIDTAFIMRQPQPKIPFWRSLNEQLVRQSYIVTLTYDVDKSFFGQQEASEEETQEPVKNTTVLGCDQLLGSLRWNDLPDPAGARPVNTRSYIQIDSEKSLCTIIQSIGYRFTRQVIQECYRFINGNVVFELSRYLQLPEDIESKSPPNTNNPLPSFNTLVSFDSENKWILMASVRVFNGNDPEQMKNNWKFPLPKKDKKDKHKKRNLNGDVKKPADDQDGDAEMVDAEPTAEIEEEESNSLVKKKDIKRRRVEQEAEPVVTDTFQTAQSREVAASAGLQAKDDGALVLQHNIQHQVSLPPDYAYTPISQHKSPEKPARVWPFELDPFQKVSIASIERNESVLVSAHTSAGKTVVAEYAIAQCLRNNQRVIYTSPIKALSNQKYREFAAEFGDVGLMTGDVTINPTATCLVMTTEILRSMLYRGSEIMREVAWVVFDEIHYMRDKSRGVVWEETIILLPDKVRYVFLSATIPNAMQFAEWITKTHQQPCHIVYTDFRPTPLQHYFFPAGADGIHLIVDEKGNFREENFQKAMSSIEEKKGSDPADINAKQKGKGKNKKNQYGRTEG